MIALRKPWRRDAATRAARLDRGDRRRTFVTPEGLSLTLTLASRGARFGALLLDLLILFAVAIAVVAFLGSLGTGAQKAGKNLSALGETLNVVFAIALFLLHNGWFMGWELGPRGATPGKRALGIRVVGRGGTRLTADMVIARNLLRDLEIFVPPAVMIAAIASGTSPLAWAAAGLFLIMALFPCFNRDRLRAGDVVAGTWVVETGRVRLQSALSLRPAEQARHPVAVAGDYEFRPQDLAHYGERELQTLERVLRDNRLDTMVEVAGAICIRIGWTSPGDLEARRFLEAYYTQLRGQLERGMRFGKRKADKHSAGG
jgi:uncharacterized RDD family membrane protein YckC